jgi:DNA-3-methyladenine glycosylase
VQIMKAEDKTDITFLERDPVLVAEQLIGCHLIRRTEKGLIRIQITETEAYRSGDDPASHAYKGMTPRNKLMFGAVGQIYVYFIYGMHFCMNIVAHEPNEAGAVLLRAGVPSEGIALVRTNRQNVADRELMNGPGKLTRALEIDSSFNGYDLLDKSDQRLILEVVQPAGMIKKTPRIGITRGIELPWRFVHPNL